MMMTWLIPALAIAPQIQASDLEVLKAQGFRAVINNRPDNEVPDQPKSVDLEIEALRLGMGYSFIPIRPGEMTDQDAVAFARASSSRWPGLGILPHRRTVNQPLETGAADAIRQA
jgi:uncharacterized protein (TIGR01244 family)